MRQTTISGHDDAGYHAKTMIRSFLFAAAALAAAFTFAAPAQAASIDTRFDVCAALRNGTSLATIEAAARHLVLRPLLTYDKVETTALARRIGTYETSILPFDDCC